MSAGAEGFKAITSHVSQEAFGHLTAGRIAGAQEQNSFHDCGSLGNQCRVRLHT